MGETFTCALISCDGIQTTNLIINLDHDEWIFSDESKTLAESGFGAYRCARLFVNASYLALPR